MALQFAGGHQVPLLPSLTVNILPAAATTSSFPSLETSLLSHLPPTVPVPIIENTRVLPVLPVLPDHVSSALPSHPDANKPGALSLFTNFISTLCGHIDVSGAFSALLRWNSDPSHATMADARRKPPSIGPKSHDYSATIANTSYIPADKERLRHVPGYVLEYAPYCHLYSEEEYWPGLISEHLDHTTPFIDYDPVPDEYQRPDLHNLDRLNQLTSIYLTSNDDPETYPDWLAGEDNIPEMWKMRGQRRKQKTRKAVNDESEPHKSSAPAVLVVVDKGEFVDAFWFFFYSFNLGNQVLGVRFGNHVGDWEHTAIRFKDGKPVEVFYSEHEWGAAYRWDDAEKYAANPKRMLTYSAYGTHAMYRTAGIQRYVLPFGLLQDTTDKGPLWDPTLNMYSYTYDPHDDVIRASNLTPDAPEEWFHFRGKWGDKYYPMDDPRQYRFLGELHYGSGPTGPKFKNLGRAHICQNKDSCIIKEAIEDRAPRFISSEEWERWGSQRRNEN